MMPIKATWTRSSWLLECLCFTLACCSQQSLVSTLLIMFSVGCLHIAHPLSFYPSSSCSESWRAQAWSSIVISASSNDLTNSDICNCHWPTNPNCCLFLLAKTIFSVSFHASWLSYILYPPTIHIPTVISLCTNFLSSVLCFSYPNNLKLGCNLCIFRP